MGKKIKDLEPVFWMFLITVAVMIIIAVKVSYGF